MSDVSVPVGIGLELSRSPSPPIVCSGLPLHLCADGRPQILPSVWRPLQLGIKSGLDRLLALLLLVVLALPLLAIALGVAFSSPGPVLFVQQREGSGGRPFRMLKFRTLFAPRCDAAGHRQVRAGDSRVTPFGRMLRRWNFDELPQLVNVLMGDMSLVGPRPYPLGLEVGGRPLAAQVPGYDARFAMKPGITGWAQCNGFRGPIDSPEAARARTRHDFAYVQNFSLLLDLRIGWLTLRQELRGGTGT